MNQSARLINISWQVAISCILMWLSGQNPFELPGMSVPITLQSMFAILLPLILNARSASGGVLLFLILGATGLPVFAGASGGIFYFYSNSGGYLIGFYAIALLTARFKNWTSEQPFLRGLLVFALMHLVLTIIGLAWIAIAGTSEITFSSHVGPYLPGVVVKSAIGALIFEVVNRIKAIKTT
ncbi:MAG: biotin transporter BioY [Flavobacteriales bacterium]